MRGDAVFDPQTLETPREYINAAQSFITVDASSFSDEEVKYTVDSDGFNEEISKRGVHDDALGAAVVINYVSKVDKKNFIKRLEQVEEQDYFEGGVELTI